MGACETMHAENAEGGPRTDGLSDAETAAPSPHSWRFSLMRSAFTAFMALLIGEEPGAHRRREEGLAGWEWVGGPPEFAYPQRPAP